MWLYCVELLLARCFLFYVCRGQFHQSHQLAWQKANCLKHHWTNVVKKYVSIHCEKTTLCIWPIWQNYCQEITVVEAKQCQKSPVGQDAQRLDNKTVESKFEIFGLNWRDYVQWRVGERAATPCITPTVKHGVGSVIVWDFCQLQSKGFAPDEGQIESDQLSQHTAASRVQLVGQGFVLMQGNDPNHTTKVCQR